MHLSYFGSDLSQDTIRLALRPDWEDKNVSPEELAAFAREQGYQALTRVNGDAEQLKLLLSNGFPVLVETWMEPKPNDGMGHYRLLTGYDDATRQWIAYDSYVSAGVDPDQPYQGITIPYSELAAQWPVFNRTYLVIYTSEQTPTIASILDADLDDARMWRHALADAEAATIATSTNAFAWFNLGTDRVALGQFGEAATAYDQARTLGLPWRMLWYQFGPFRAYYEVGRYDELLALADASLVTTPYVEEFHTWRGMALEALGDVTAAQEAFRRAQRVNPLRTLDNQQGTANE
jgi:tetratricopeptide (TPR) repeat protein